MATTISKPGKRSHLQRTARSREAGFSRSSRDHKPLSEIRPRSIAHDLNGTIEEELKTAFPAAPFVSGAKAIVPVLLAPILSGWLSGLRRLAAGFRLSRRLPCRCSSSQAPRS